MKTRNEKLNRLRVGTPCQESWDGMVGDERQRFCDQCQRTVFDFAQMTPREIRSHLEAGRGQTCARLTFVGQRLKVIQPIESKVSKECRHPGRLAPLAATLVTAWLGFGSAATAQPAPAVEPAPATPLSPEAATQAARRSVPTAPGATLRGRVMVEGQALPRAVIVARQALDGRERTTLSSEDGTFVFRNLPSGVYDLSGTAEGFEVEAIENVVLEAGRERKLDLNASLPMETFVTGSVGSSTPRLPSLFEDSTLVVSAVTGNSKIVWRDGERIEIATTLDIEQVLKGDFGGRSVDYLHTDFLVTAESTPDAPRPGIRVLAFLGPREGGNGEEGYGLEDFQRGLWELSPEEHEYYLKRILALAAAQEDPAHLADWLVAAVEDPVSRVDGAVTLLDALQSLRDLAEREGKSSQELAEGLRRALQGKRDQKRDATRPIFVAAALTDDHKTRLIEALSASETLRHGDRVLYFAIELLDPAAGRTWLGERLRAVDPPVDEAEDLYWWLRYLAEDLGSPAATALVEEVSTRADEIDDAVAEAEEPDEKQRLEQYAALDRDLMRKLAELLKSESD